MPTVRELLILMSSWRWWLENKRSQTEAVFLKQHAIHVLANIVAKTKNNKKKNNDFVAIVASSRIDTHSTDIYFSLLGHSITSSMRSSWRQSRITAALEFNQSFQSTTIRSVLAVRSRYFSQNAHHQLSNAEFQKKKELYAQHAFSEWSPSILLNHVLLFITMCFTFFLR